jgi:hypothetical protein
MTLRGERREIVIRAAAYDALDLFDLLPHRPRAIDHLR